MSADVKTSVEYAFCAARQSVCCVVDGSIPNSATLYRSDMRRIELLRFCMQNAQSRPCCCSTHQYTSTPLLSVLDNATSLFVHQVQRSMLPVLHVHYITSHYYFLSSSTLLHFVHYDLHNQVSDVPVFFACS